MTVARPSTGRVCACGRAKSKQGRQCQRCRTLEKRGATYVRTHLLGKPDPRWQHITLERVRAAAGGELAELILQQRRDDTGRAHSEFHLSLDDGLYEVIAA